MRGVRAVALRTLLTDLSPVGTLKKKIEKEVAAKELEGSMTPVAAEAPRPSLFGGVSPSKRRMSAAERKQQQQQKQGQQSVADIVPDTFFDGIDVVYIAAPNMFNDRCKENDLTRGAHFDGNASLNNSSGGNRNKNQRFNRFSNKKPVRGSVEEFIRACMERGKHVLVEPPTAPNSFTISRLMETSTFKNNNKAKVVLMDRAASVWTDSSRLKFLKGLLGVNPLPSMTPQKPAGGGRGGWRRERQRTAWPWPTEPHSRCDCPRTVGGANTPQKTKSTVLQDWTTAAIASPAVRAAVGPGKDTNRHDGDPFCRWRRGPVVLRQVRAVH
ncbi:hypothetical protein ADEAN_000820300 [Angomonas deanei]|uniref:Uncharacterized protein n=1 Tax=Angomonas deanei TaxID=59799 RepID=A0A7G2CP09_9TRYP|nr:hypothetical protein ADEAN_000820300 [Angomonas deanei]